MTMDPRHPLYDPKCQHYSNWETVVEFVRWYVGRNPFVAVAFVIAMLLVSLMIVAVLG